MIVLTNGELVIDKDARGGFVQFDLVGLPGGKFGEKVKLLGRCDLGSVLGIPEGRLRPVKPRFRLSGVLFPEGLFLLAFLNLLNPFQPFIIGQKVLAPRIALQHDVQLIMYGENQAEYHNKISETVSPLMSRSHYTCSPDQKFFFGGLSTDELKAKHGITPNDLVPYMPVAASDASM